MLEYVCKLVDKMVSPLQLFHIGSKCIFHVVWILDDGGCQLYACGRIQYTSICDTDNGICGTEYACESTVEPAEDYEDI